MQLVTAFDTTTAGSRSRGQVSSPSPSSWRVHMEFGASLMLIQNPDAFTVQF
jgi:hypothetical protein